MGHITKKIKSVAKNILRALGLGNYSKLEIISCYVQKYHPTYFVETGTYVGDTLAVIAPLVTEAHSIELDEELFLRARKRFESYPNVILHHGDSAQLLSNVIQQLDKPILFWLDGHYSGSATAHGVKDTPIEEELHSIFKNPTKKHLILIDDARLFNGTDDYPMLSSIQELAEYNNYKCTVADDIIRLLPIIYDRKN